MVGSASTIRLFTDGFALHLPTVAWNQSAHTKPRSGNPHDVRLSFVQSASNPSLQARDYLPTIVNDYRAADASQWRQNLRQAATVHYQTLYPKIDLDYTLDDAERLKSTYVVQPQGDPTLIHWRYQGVHDLTIASDGALVLTLPPQAGVAQRTITETAPIAWQNVGAARVFVPVRFQVAVNNQVSFVVGTYDPTLPLVIDPTLNTVPLTGLRYPLDMTTDAQGYLYIVGDSSTAGRLIKRTPTGQIQSTTLFGATGSVQANAVAVAADGRIAVVGSDSFAPDGSTQRSFVAQWSSSGSYSLLPFAANAYTYADDVAYNPVTQTFFVVWSIDVLNDANVQSTLAQVSAGGVISAQAIEPYSRDLAIDSAGTIYTTYSLGDSFFSEGKLVKRSGGTVTVFDTVGISKVAVDSANNVYTTGTREIQNAGTLIEKRWEVQSWSAAGSGRYRYRLLHTNRLYPNDLVIAADGTAIVVGGTDAPEFPIVGGSGSLQVGRYAGFIAHIDSNGVVKSSDVSYQSGTGGTTITTVALNPSPTLVIAGFASVDATFVKAFISAPPTVVVPPPPPPTTQAPDFTTSYFVQYVDAQSAYDIGCATRATMPNKSKVIVFDFGSPRAFDADREPIFDATTPIASRGVKLLPPANKYVSMSDLKIFTAQFVRGYKSFACGNDPLPSITIVLGTTNSQICKEDKITACTLVDNNALTSQHGKAWATMVADLNRDIPGGTIIVAGGYDAEFGLGWNSAGTMEWADGYTSNRSATLYNFGDCNGCPRNTARSTWSQQQLSRLEQVYQLSWGMLWTRPLPEIFLNSYQDEWYNVIRYGREFYPDDPSMIIAGVMTDCQFTEGCDPNDETTQWTSVPYPGTEGVNNFPPKIGWRAMADTLTKSTAPDGSPNMIFKHTPRWLTDIAQQQ